MLQRSASPLPGHPAMFLQGPALPMQFVRHSSSPGRGSPGPRVVVGSPRGVVTAVVKQPTLAAAAAAATGATAATAPGRPSSPFAPNAMSSSTRPVASFVAMATQPEARGRPIAITATARSVTPRSRIMSPEPVATGVKQENESLVQHMKALQQAKSVAAAQQAFTEQQLTIRQENLRRETFQALSQRPRGLADALKMWPSPGTGDLMVSQQGSHTMPALTATEPLQMLLSPRDSTAMGGGLSATSHGVPLPTSAILQTHGQWLEEDTATSEAFKQPSPRGGTQGTPWTAGAKASPPSPEEGSWRTQGFGSTSSSVVMDQSLLQASVDRSSSAASAATATQAAVASAAKRAFKAAQAVQERFRSTSVVDAGSGATTDMVVQDADEDFGSSSHLIYSDDPCAAAAAAVAASEITMNSVNAGGIVAEKSLPINYGVRESPPQKQRAVRPSGGMGGPVSTLSPRTSSPPPRGASGRAGASERRAVGGGGAGSLPSGRAASPARSPSPLRRLHRDEVEAEQERCRQTMSACVQALTPTALRELRQFSKLPPSVATVLEAMCLLLNVADVHLPAPRRRLLGEGFTEKLLHFDFEAVTATQYRKMRKLFASIDDEALRGVCPVAVPLAMWCRAIMACLAKTRWPSGGVETPASTTSPLPTPAPPSPAPAPAPATGDRQFGRPRIELVITPDLSLLRESELRAVSELEVCRPGVGSITFHGVTDCRRLDVESLVHLDVGEVLVYPVQGLKPPPGQGLNKCSTVCMYQCWPPNGRGNLEDTTSRERYKGKIRAMTEEKRARFIDYDCSTGVWKFQVEHF